MTATLNEVSGLSRNLGNWLTLKKFVEQHPEFTYSQIRYLYLHRKKRTGLETCFRQVGRKGYGNPQLFGLYLAGLLPEQQV